MGDGYCFARNGKQWTCLILDSHGVENAAHLIWTFPQGMANNGPDPVIGRGDPLVVVEDVVLERRSIGGG